MAPCEAKSEAKRFYKCNSEVLPSEKTSGGVGLEIWNKKEEEWGVGRQITHEGVYRYCFLHSCSVGAGGQTQNPPGTGLHQRVCITPGYKPGAPALGGVLRGKPVVLSSSVIEEVRIEF